MQLEARVLPREGALFGSDLRAVDILNVVR